MDIADLVAGLRVQAKSYRRDDWDMAREPDAEGAIADEAADAIERLQAELAEAVLAEREACAKVAECEQMLAHDGLDLTGFHGENTRCRVIAAAIRQRTDDAGR